MSNIMHTKAGFRALRELCGLSQLEVADHLGKNVSTVKKWESEKYTQVIPSQSWDFLEDTWSHLQDAADHAVSQIINDLDSGQITQPVQLPYYRSRVQYERSGAHVFDDFGCTDALSRLVALRLDALGIDVEMRYPVE